jgi:hypothetical protein
VTLQRGLSDREGWRRYVDRPPRARPEQRTMAQLRALSDEAHADYAEARRIWHRNLPIVRVPQLDALHEAIDEIVESNPDDSDRIRGVAAIDALPGLGKTTIANTFGREFDRADIRRYGPLTDTGHDRIPVFRVGITANTTIKTLNEMICQFYGHPVASKSTRSVSAGRLASFALDSVLSCETKLGIVDDVHFILPRRKDGLDVINHLKYLNSEFPVTFLFAGVELEEKGFFSEGAFGAGAKKAQLGRRWTRLEVTPFQIDDDDGRREWQSLLKAAEQRIVLTRARPGMLVGISDYLFERTTGHIGSLFSLLSRGSYRAIRLGEENLTRDLLAAVRIDEASEKARRELAVAFAAGRLTSRPAARKKLGARAAKTAEAV